MRVVCVCVYRERENERAKGVSAKRRGLTHVASGTTSLSLPPLFCLSRSPIHPPKALVTRGASLHILTVLFFSLFKTFIYVLTRSHYMIVTGILVTEKR